MVKIARYIQAGRFESGGIFGVGSNQVLIPQKKRFESLVKIASFLKRETDSDNLYEYIKNNVSGVSEDDINFSLSLFREKNSLMSSSYFNSDDRYSRNVLYYHYLGANSKEVQEKISKSKVTIIGCGGIGNHISYLLATSGVGTISIVDSDIIEISNLTRQVLFSEKDVNFLKIDILERELLKRNSELNVKKVNLEIKHKDDLSKIEKSDLFIVSADTPFELINWVNDYCFEKKQPYLNVGYINDISVIGPFVIPGETACFSCSKVVPDYACDDELQDNLATINSDFKAATFPSVNGVAASYAFGDVMKFLGGYGEILSKNRRIGIHSRKIKIETQEIPKNERCNICGLQPK
ncbi:HesA/MoeB/ThiF family protein [Photorhabdus heterorhabditis]|uniref:MccB protein n=1 Tax=Photorhabdus heterorhabditis TaxID=880156 RepID=A0ABR5KE88_9GAMM|nr:ThiF family adenylyltransferase [Photorhabdus heterorhabditis]KOY62943.1 MccB protein [Photorhabdus heterorhabditis]MBS9440854.1 ThiF family adenylyltransferase [Photorhabdus heterorhabditis]